MRKAQDASVVPHHSDLYWGIMVVRTPFNIEPNDDSWKPRAMKLMATHF